FTFGANNISIGGHIGGLVGGAIAALVVKELDRRRMPNAKTVEYVALAALCVLAFAGGIIAAESSVPAALNAREPPCAPPRRGGRPPSPASPPGSGAGRSGPKRARRGRSQ